jgi:tryptophan synthase alpha chain
MSPGEPISRAIRAQREALNAPALIPYLTGGFPSKSTFTSVLQQIAPHAAAIEIGIPFSDPMADGVTIQRTSRIALQQQVTLQWILDELAAAKPAAPLILMGYLNPFLRYGLPALAEACAAGGIHALIVPDLPLEESAPIRHILHSRNIGLVQLVSPVTPLARARQIAENSDGFLYAVTITGVTGGAVSRRSAPEYIQQLRDISPIPVCAGFGIRTAADLDSLAAADGVIVGSALAEAIERGEDPGQWLHALRAPSPP